MRLLQRDGTGRLTLTKDLDGDSIPEYAILSHTWGRDEDEATFDDLTNGTGEDKPGYEKIRFCDEQANRDGLRFFWIDTCCINKSSEAELARSINSMFRWYRNASRCYVYLSDVSCTSADISDEGNQALWESDFRKSRWFTRGWTLQELLAPVWIEFFSREGRQLSDKSSLGQVICEITNIPHSALQGDPLSWFSFQERSRWIQHRQTQREEDIAYSLLGIFDVYILPIYGEGKAGALARLKDEFDKMQRCIQDLHLTDPRDDKKRIEDTKGGLFKDSYCWILENSDFQKWRTAPQSRLLWIKGDPGKGKTMLLCGIINELERSTANSDLLSYFFYQATDSRINNATAMLRGLIYMLVGQQPSLVSHVRKKYDQRGKALFEDANAWVALSEIFTSILQDSNLNTTYLIIDALDECVTDLPKLLEFIVRKSSESPRVKWIISSRNWPDIGEWLVNAGQNLSLELNAESVSAAVSTFTQHRVLGLVQRKKYNNKIRDAVLDHLSANANGTFLWVALVCQDLENIPKFAVLARLNDFPPGLDALYERMMKQIRSSDYADLCNRILASIAIVYRPVTVLELTSLIDKLDDISDDIESLHEIIGFCGSFLSVREGAIYFVHQSAKDFLLSKAFDEIFPRGKEGTHHDIFLRSLEVMSNTLKRDIYDLKTPGIYFYQIEKPEPDPLAAARYSCLFWVDHLIDCCMRENKIKDPEDSGSIYKFLRERFLYWLEALSLMETLPDAIVMIRKLEDIQFVGSPELSAFIYDAKRFALYNRSVIEQTPLQSYCSALVFSPEKSIVRETFQHCIPSWIQRRPTAQVHWSAALQILEGHSGQINSVAFSPDGMQVVSGCAENIVHLWDARTGAMLQTLTGRRSIHFVYFSLDGKHIVSGSNDGCISLWDAATGVGLQIFKHDRGSAYSVAFSPDRKQVVSASVHMEISLWDAATGALRKKFKGHIGHIVSLVFTLDSKQIVSGSHDHTIRIWDVALGVTLQTLTGHSGKVNCIVLSPDNKQILSGSDDTTIRLWDAATGAMLHILEGHSDSVRSVAFSLDGKLVVSGSNDTTVRLWDASGAAVKTLHGHLREVLSVAFSSDSKQVVSGSTDFTVRLWDVAGTALHMAEGHSKTVTSIAFSLGGNQVVTGSEDGTIWLWDNTGAVLLRIEGLLGYVYSVAMSPNNKLIASTSADGTIRLWDTSGAALQTLKGHLYQIHSVAFSPDSKLIISGGEDETVRLWDTMGALLQTFGGYPGHITSVAFSTDGKQILTKSYEIHFYDKKTRRLWDVATGAVVLTVKGGHSRAALPLPFSPYGMLPTTPRVSYDWVVDGKSKILWLPPEYRPRCFASWGSTIALGHETGRISFIEFKEGSRLTI